MQTKSLLSNERRVLGEELGFSKRIQSILDVTSVDAAFVDDATKRKFYFCGLMRNINHEPRASVIY